MSLFLNLKEVERQDVQVKGSNNNNSEVINWWHYVLRNEVLMLLFTSLSNVMEVYSKC